MEVCRFCGTKMRYVRQTPDCMRAMPVLTMNSPLGPRARLASSGYERGGGIILLL